MVASALTIEVRRGENNQGRIYGERRKHKPEPAVAWTGLLGGMATNLDCAENGQTNPVVVAILPSAVCRLLDVR